MELKTEKNQENKSISYLEIDCDYKDVDEPIICDGVVSLVRFFYKKNITLSIGSIGIGSYKDVDMISLFMVYVNDVNYFTCGITDWILPKNVKFKKGEPFVFKQHNIPISKKDGITIDYKDRNNMVEKIRIYLNE